MEPSNTITKTDEGILNALLEDPRLSYREIAKKAGVSVVTAMNRAKKLEKEGIIKGYTTKLDYERIGYEFHVMIDMRVSKGRFNEVESKIAKSPNVVACYDVTGDFDAAIIARFRNRRGLDEFLKRIQKLDFVERTNTKLILSTVKEKEMGV
ncbi:AsnC family transcriptional regulator [Candidatus Woesearchaeota archaeon CG10_big_fil_rev_8_21_14_0_10_44_13]|nr:MAG: AsnC family transcriptional regulator [Candidatus Woesearchaeota archaeon CG10_big_fil_rev_8_21_14_0_10_44_13]